MALFYPADKITFQDHPRFEGVKLAKLVTGKDTDTVSVCILEIAPDTLIPIHTHDPNVDSIYILEGSGEAYVDGDWKEVSAGDYIFVKANEEHGVRSGKEGHMKLFVVHSPPLF